MFRYLLFASLLGPTSVVAQQFFNATSQIPVAATIPLTMDVEFVDIDNDGDADAILASEFAPNLILVNDGGGTFTLDSNITFPPIRDYTNLQYKGEDSEDIAIADFNGDTILDVFFASEDTPFHELYFGTSNGGMTPAPNQLTVPRKANAVVTMDANGDGFADLLIGYQGQNELLLNDGAGNFALDTTQIFPVNLEHTQDLKLIDIDGDLDLDIWEGNELGGSNVYELDNGVYTERTDSWLPDLTMYETRKVVLADIDNDGDQDAFLCNVLWRPNTASGSRLLINDGNGTYTDETTTLFPYVEGFTLDAVFVDLNRDGLKDLITVGTDDVLFPKCYINRIDSVGSFVEDNTLMPYVYQDRILAIVAIDVNNDRLEDLYIGSTPDRLLIQDPFFNGLDHLSSGSEKAYYNAAGHEIRVELEYSPNTLELLVFDVTGRRIEGETKSIDNGLVFQLPDSLHHTTLVLSVVDQQQQIKYSKPLVVD